MSNPLRWNPFEPRTGRQVAKLTMVLVYPDGQVAIVDGKNVLLDTTFEVWDRDMDIRALPEVLPRSTSRVNLKITLDQGILREPHDLTVEVHPPWSSPSSD